MATQAPSIIEAAGRLTDALRGMRSVVVALSGGVDSAVVAHAARMALGDSAVAVTADSPSVARADLADARRVASHIGIRHVVIRTEEFADDDYARNDGSRCYHCKSELYDRIEGLRSTLQFRVICSGANLDDRGDYRPGLTAAAEHGVQHPLQLAGLGKADVRALARHWNLPVADKPASPCLSSRIAPGVAATIERAGRIEAAESYLRSLSLPDCRVRLHEGELARIEVPADAIQRLADADSRAALTREFRRLGFAFVTIDLEGFRSGSLNELIDLEVRRRFTPEAAP